MNNFRKIGDLNVDSLRRMIQIGECMFSKPNPTLKQGDLGYSHRNTNIILCRYAPMAPNIATNEDEQQKTKDSVFAVDYPARAFFRDTMDPLIYMLMQDVKGTHLGGIGIIRVPPGADIEEHVDLGLSADFYRRFHITVDGPPDCTFICGEGEDKEEVSMLDGEVFWFNCQKVHAVKNRSDRARVSVSVDINMM